MHTTNYSNTFIAVADDCPVSAATIPVINNDKPSAAALQYEMIKNNPYKYDSDSVLFNVYATKKDLSKSQLREEREIFFSKGQACMRASPLTKRYGWGVHCNEEGKIALIAVESEAYEKMLKDKSLAQVKAMRSKKA